MPSLLSIIFGFTFIFFMTSFGATIVFLFKNPISAKLNSLILGLASGIMISASIWSLLLPALSLCEDMGKLKAVPSLVGLFLGSLFIIVLDKFIPQSTAQNKFSSNRKFTKLFVVITLHNIPEGLSVGFVFGLACFTICCVLHRG